MEKMVLDDFIRYAKEQFDCEISVKKCDKPDTFASIFGASFLNDKNCVEMVDGGLIKTRISFLHKKHGKTLAPANKGLVFAEKYAIMFTMVMTENNSVKAVLQRGMGWCDIPHGYGRDRS